MLLWIELIQKFVEINEDKKTCGKQKKNKEKIQKFLQKDDLLKAFNFYPKSMKSTGNSTFYTFTFSSHTKLML